MCALVAYHLYFGGVQGHVSHVRCRKYEAVEPRVIGVDAGALQMWWQARYVATTTVWMVVWYSKGVHGTMVQYRCRW